MLSRHSNVLLRSEFKKRVSFQLNRQTKTIFKNSCLLSRDMPVKEIYFRNCHAYINVIFQSNLSSHRGLIPRNSNSNFFIQQILSQINFKHLFIHYIKKHPCRISANYYDKRKPCRYLLIISIKDIPLKSLRKEYYTRIKQGGSVQVCTMNY